MNKYESLKKQKSEVRRQNRQKRLTEDIGKKTPKAYGYRQLSLPEEVLEQLKNAKKKYEDAWNGRLTYGDVIGQLLLAARKFDPKVFQEKEKKEKNEKEELLEPGIDIEQMQRKFEEGFKGLETETETETETGS